jgi:hypothetical protein
MLAMKKSFILAFLALALLVLTSLPSASLVSAQQNEPAYATVSMPVEYINYAVVWVNGSLWAKIDGTYPIYLQGNLPETLPMVYPTPPQTTNISIKLNDKELTYSNYSDAYPFALHHTGIGDWQMVSTMISPVSDHFTLKIHYEHPLQVVNGSYLFLYDLNISPYLSTANNNSTAYFTVRMETNYTNLQAYTTETDAKWNPINYTVTKEGSMDIVSIVMYSEYSKPLLGDLVVEFSGSEIPEYPYLGVVVVAAGFSTLALVYIKSKRYHAKPTLKFEQNS